MSNPVHQLLAAHLTKLERQNESLQVQVSRQTDRILALEERVRSLEHAVAKFRETSQIAARHRARAREQHERAEHWKHRALQLQKAQEIESYVLRDVPSPSRTTSP